VKLLGAPSPSRVVAGVGVLAVVVVIVLITMFGDSGDTKDRERFMQRCGRVVFTPTQCELLYDEFK
jgi:hypothetical protein